MKRGKGKVRSLSVAIVRLLFDNKKDIFEMKTTHTKAQLAREAESLRQDLRDCSAIARKALKGRALPHEEDEFTEAPTTCLIAEMADEIAELRLALMASKMTPPNALDELHGRSP